MPKTMQELLAEPIRSSAQRVADEVRSALAIVTGPKAALINGIESHVREALPCDTTADFWNGVHFTLVMVSSNSRMELALTGGILMMLWDDWENARRVEEWPDEV